MRGPRQRTGVRYDQGAPGDDGAEGDDPAGVADDLTVEAAGPTPRALPRARAPSVEKGDVSTIVVEMARAAISPAALLS
ncbi:hypothetical protein [Streptomyces heilongjiangensis]|uniref:hypothetical protein n=1 Tax=Streptomyces heilongjiangensis TaxID=945052 RepID=UPI0023311776|nr:hypothetical protein [Streptomyces heilongjiangensis]MDC2947941.1 hypothetical protein [Streptomyces heilongjiangensis]